MKFNPAKDFERLVWRLSVSEGFASPGFSIRHGIYQFTKKQDRLLKELDDLFIADIKDLVSDFEKSLI